MTPQGLPRQGALLSALLRPSGRRPGQALGGLSFQCQLQTESRWGYVLGLRPETEAALRSHSWGSPDIGQTHLSFSRPMKPPCLPTPGPGQLSLSGPGPHLLWWDGRRRPARMGTEVEAWPCRDHCHLWLLGGACQASLLEPALAFVKGGLHVHPEVWCEHRHPCWPPVQTPLFLLSTARCLPCLPAASPHRPVCNVCSAGGGWAPVGGPPGWASLRQVPEEGVWTCGYSNSGAVGRSPRSPVTLSRWVLSPFKNVTYSASKHGFIREQQRIAVLDKPEK